MIRIERVLVAVCCLAVSWFGARVWLAVMDQQMAPAVLEMPSVAIPVAQAASQRRWPRNPFRVSGGPTEVATESESQLQVSSDGEIEGLQVRAIAGGPPWRAVLSRVPGFQSDVVVEAGESVGRYKIESIDSASVVVRVGESTLTVKLETFRKPEMQ